jgi:hypothetical protein
MKIQSANFQMKIDENNQVSRSDFESAQMICRGMGVSNILVNDKPVSMAVGQFDPDKLRLVFIDPTAKIEDLFEQE